jgi:hypothetical protein
MRDGERVGVSRRLEFTLLGTFLVDGEAPGVGGAAQQILATLAVRAATSKRREVTLETRASSGDLRTALLGMFGIRTRESQRVFYWDPAVQVSSDLERWLDQFEALQRTRRIPVSLVRSLLREGAPLVPDVASVRASDGTLADERTSFDARRAMVARYAAAIGDRIGDVALIGDALVKLEALDPATAASARQRQARGEQPFPELASKAIARDGPFFADAPFADVPMIGRGPMVEQLLERVRIVMERDVDTHADAVILTGAWQVGKSRVAAEAMRRVHRELGVSAGWIDGSELGAQMRALSVELGIEVAGRLPGAVQHELKAALRQHSPWCLVIDGVDPHDDDVATWWSGTEGGLWIFTGDDGGREPPAVVRVEPLEEHERAALIRTAGVDEDVVDDLTSALAGATPRVIAATAAEVARGRLAPQEAREWAEVLMEQGLGEIVAPRLRPLADWARAICGAASWLAAAPVSEPLLLALAAEAGGPPSAVRVRAELPWVETGRLFLDEPLAAAIRRLTEDQASVHRGQAAKALMTAMDGAEGAELGSVLDHAMQLLNRAGAVDASGQLAELARRLVDPLTARGRLREAAAAAEMGLPAGDVRAIELHYAMTGKLDPAQFDAMLERAVARDEHDARIARMCRRFDAPRQAVAVLGQEVDGDEAAIELLAAWQDIGTITTLGAAPVELPDGDPLALMVYAARERTAGRLEEASAAVAASLDRVDVDALPLRAEVLLLDGRIALDRGRPRDALARAGEASMILHAMHGEPSPRYLDALAQHAEALLWRSEVTGADRPRALRDAREALGDAADLDHPPTDVRSAWRTLVAARLLAHMDPERLLDALAAIERAQALVEAKRPGSVMSAIVDRHRYWLHALAPDLAASVGWLAPAELSADHPEHGWRALAEGDVRRHCDLDEARQRYLAARRIFRRVHGEHAITLKTVDGRLNGLDGPASHTLRRSDD